MFLNELISFLNGKVLKILIMILKITIESFEQRNFIYCYFRFPHFLHNNSLNIFFSFRFSLRTLFHKSKIMLERVKNMLRYFWFQFKAQISLIFIPLLSDLRDLAFKGIKSVSDLTFGRGLLISFAEVLNEHMSTFLCWGVMIFQSLSTSLLISSQSSS